MAKYWVAIAKHETGNFTSKLFRESNNLFGMGVPDERQSDRIGEIDSSEGPKSVYRDAAQSVEDLLLYLDARNYAKDYATFDLLLQVMAGKGWFTDPDYEQKVKRYL